MENGACMAPTTVANPLSSVTNPVGVIHGCGQNLWILVARHKGICKKPPFW